MFDIDRIKAKRRWWAMPTLHFCEFITTNLINSIYPLMAMVYPLLHAKVNPSDRVIP